MGLCVLYIHWHAWSAYYGIRDVDRGLDLGDVSMRYVINSGMRFAALIA